MREPPVLVELRRAAEGSEWRALPAWPRGDRLTRYHLQPDPAPPNAAIRGGPQPWFEGSLAAALPAAGAAAVTLRELPDVAPYIVYGYTVAGVEPISAVWTLPALPLGREIVGRPVVRLWVSSPAPDVDVHVYLLAEHRRGGAEVVASGVLRASHRATGPAPYDTGGVPWHTHRRADGQLLQPGTPVALDIGLSAAAYALQPGDRLRLAVSPRGPRERGAGAPELTIHSSRELPSWVDIPDVDTRAMVLERDPTALPQALWPPLVGTRAR